MGYYYHNGKEEQAYVVVPLRFNQFHDLHKLAKENYGFFKQTTTGKRVNWVKMKIINKGNNKITELRTILQRESPNS